MNAIIYRILSIPKTNKYINKLKVNIKNYINDKQESTKLYQILTPNNPNILFLSAFQHF
uniref:Uncharacterized protein n=1 Tax=Anguilla anguilla TaxID=7936 RepID=A0A0E9RF64_ANGAN